MRKYLRKIFAVTVLHLALTLQLQDQQEAIVDLI